MGHVVAVLATALPGAAFAQDMAGALNIPDLARSQVQSATTRAYAEREGWRDGRVGTSPSRTAQTCASVPHVRARPGIADPRFQELARLCRKAGY